MIDVFILASGNDECFSFQNKRFCGHGCNDDIRLYHDNFSDDNQNKNFLILLNSTDQEGRHGGGVAAPCFIFPWYSGTKSAVHSCAMKW
jgi:hypothetical protein